MNKVALVTGGTRGIGSAIAQHLHNLGFTVACSFVGHTETALECARRTGIKTYKFDAGDYHACQNSIQTIEAELGPIEVLVNNAGITRDGFFHKMDPQDWMHVIQTNLISVFNITHQVINGMRERQYGRIINISSINGQKGQIGQTNYCAAKSGILGFTRALALESASKGITVNAIAPGYIGTDMVAGVNEEILKKIIGQIPVGRLGTPEEVARAVGFLASPDASFITGATLSINGGQLMSL
jgi:acetoacetyl-CoA reductase